MKKYSVFIVSFIFIFSLLIISAQLLSGIFLTLLYTPDIDTAWDRSVVLPQQAEITFTNSSIFLTIILSVLSATIAYLVAQKYEKRVKKVNKL